MDAFYVICAVLSWGCILTVLLFDVVFGLRARFRIKKERITTLQNGFSPLDYQRVMKGKTRPDRLTRALLVWWAQRGYIKIEERSRNTVRVWKVQNMPPHEEAEFYDRGTYVREQKIFNHVFYDVALNSGYKDIELNKPLVTRKDGEAINKSFMSGENEGVFGTGHFILKIVTQALCIVPYFLAVAWAAYSTENGGVLYIGLSIFSVIGVMALKYLSAVPSAIRYPFFSIWGGVPYIASMTQYFQDVYDPWYFGFSALLFYSLGTFFFILFADYREKENLKEYSDLYNFRKHLLFVPRKAVEKDDYYDILPFLYTMNLAFLLKGKFRSEKLPLWYRGGEGGRLL